MENSCPINASLLVIGDRWSLLIVRDLLFAGYRTFNQFLRSAEGVATNILADRIKNLLDAGIITKAADPGDGRKWIYSLTPKGVDLAPVLLELSKWGSRYQNGIAPPGVLARWEADRTGFLAQLHRRAGTESTPPPTRRPPPAPRPAPKQRTSTRRG